MSLDLPPPQDAHPGQTTQGLRSLLMLGAACALFVAIVYAVVAPAPEPPVAQMPAAAPAVAEPATGS